MEGATCTSFASIVVSLRILGTLATVLRQLVQHYTTKTTATTVKPTTTTSTTTTEEPTTTTTTTTSTTTTTVSTRAVASICASLSVCLCGFLSTCQSVSLPVYMSICLFVTTYLSCKLQPSNTLLTSLPRSFHCFHPFRRQHQQPLPLPPPSRRRRRRRRRQRKTPSPQPHLSLSPRVPPLLLSVTILTFFPPQTFLEVIFAFMVVSICRLSPPLSRSLSLSLPRTL